MDLILLRWLILLLMLVWGISLPAQQKASDSDIFAEIKAFAETKAKAEKGDAKSQERVARFYASGVGVTEDLFEAVKWYRKAAEQGNASAQRNLGVCYSNGLGVLKDDAEAHKWNLQAA